MIVYRAKYWEGNTLKDWIYNQYSYSRFMAVSVTRPLFSMYEGVTNP